MMTMLHKTLKQALIAVGGIATVAMVTLSQTASAASAGALMGELDGYESRLVAPPFLSAAQGSDAGKVRAALAMTEMLLDFPSTGYFSPFATQQATITVSEVVDRALTNRATLVKRACTIVDTAAPIGRPSLSNIANRLNAIQSALQQVSGLVSPSGRISLSMAEGAIYDIQDMMDTLGLEGTYADAFDTGTITVSALNAAVEDMYHRAALVCGTYGP